MHKNIIIFAAVGFCFVNRHLFFTFLFFQFYLFLYFTTIRAQCWKRRDFLWKPTTKSWQCIDNASYWRSRCQKLISWYQSHWMKVTNKIYGPKCLEEFEVGQVTHTTIVTVHQLCQKVQALTSGPAGSHWIGSQVYSKLKQGLPLSQEDLRIIGGSKFVSKRLFNFLKYFFATGEFHIARLIELQFILMNMDAFTTNRINSRLKGLLPGKGKIIDIFYIFT